MKIAFVTDDGKNISRHFGRAPFFLVIEVVNGEVKGRELRSKVGHREFHGEEGSGSAGHGFGPLADKKHEAMLKAALDCDVIIAGGMGYGAYKFFTSKGKKVIVTEETEVDRALTLMLEGRLKGREDLLD